MANPAQVRGVIVVTCGCGYAIPLRPPQYTGECDGCGRQFRLVVEMLTRDAEEKAEDG